MIDEIEIKVWEREFSLPIEYNCYEGEKATRQQGKSLKNFLSHPEWIEKSKSFVEKFCKEQVDEDDENENKDNIFSYIKPECIFVKRELEHPRVAIMCKYRYDIEHGIAIIFSWEGDVIVGLQDLIL